MAIEEAFRIIPPEATGLYRLRISDQAGLLYIGQGKVLARMNAHLGKGGQPSHRQSSIFASTLECSWIVAPSWLAHQRLELENDLMAAYVLSTGTIPPAQFID
jgi:hypothetical protein